MLPGAPCKDGGEWAFPGAQRDLPEALPGRSDPALQQFSPGYTANPSPCSPCQGSNQPGPFLRDAGCQEEEGVLHQKTLAASTGPARLACPWRPERLSSPEGCGAGAALQPDPRGPGPSFSFAVSLPWGEEGGTGISVALPPPHITASSPGQHLHRLELGQQHPSAQGAPSCPRLGCRRGSTVLPFCLSQPGLGSGAPWTPSLLPIPPASMQPLVS